MRQSYHLPQDDGSRRSRCPPSHHEMALMPYYAQASAWAPQPSPPLTHSPVLPGKVSPHHQQGSKTPWAAPPAPLARADPPEYGDPPGRSVGLMAPSPMPFGASTPSYSSHSSVSFRSMGGGIYPDGLAYSAVGCGDSIQSPDELGTIHPPACPGSDGTFTSEPPGEKLINGHGKSSSASLFDEDHVSTTHAVFVVSLPTVPKQGGSKPGRASRCHRPPVLETAPLALPLV
jgi:hypothetical protein